MKPYIHHCHEVIVRALVIVSINFVICYKVGYDSCECLSAADSRNGYKTLQVQYFKIPVQNLLYKFFSFYSYILAVSTQLHTLVYGIGVNHLIKSGSSTLLLDSR